MGTATIRAACTAAETYIPIDRYQATTTIQADAVGTVTFQVYGTGDSILYSTAALAAVNLQNNAAHRQDPTTAFWTSLIASGSVDASVITDAKYRALRVSITAGAGSVNLIVNQGGGA